MRCGITFYRFEVKEFLRHLFQKIRALFGRWQGVTVTYSTVYGPREGVGYKLHLLKVYYITQGAQDQNHCLPYCAVYTIQCPRIKRKEETEEYIFKKRRKENIINLDKMSLILLLI